MIGKSKLNKSGVSSLTLARALSTPPISPAMDTFEEIQDEYYLETKIILTICTIYLVTLLVRVAPIAVREVDVAIGFCHDAPYRVPALADNVAMVSVTNVHLHRDTGVSRCVQHLGDHHLSPHHTLLRPTTNTDVRILLTLCANLQPEIEKEKVKDKLMVNIEYCLRTLRAR